MVRCAFVMTNAQRAGPYEGMLRDRSADSVQEYAIVHAGCGAHGKM